MMSPAGASRAVVPVLPVLFVPPGCPAALGAGAGMAAAPAAAFADVPDAAELAALLAEHPATSKPPPSMAAPMARPATPNRARLVPADRRFKPRVFSMPL